MTAKLTIRMRLLVAFGLLVTALVVDLGLALAQVPETVEIVTMWS